jgi:hypothetical protein
MKLDENYSIEKDDYSYNLVFMGKVRIIKEGKNKGKETQTKNIWYYPSVSTALMGYLDKRLDPNGKTADQVMDQINEIKEIIKNALKIENK